MSPRIVLDVDDATNELLDSMKVETGKSLSQLFKESIILLSLTVSAKKKDQGSKLVVMDNSGNKISGMLEL